MLDAPVGTVWRLKSGRYVEVKGVMRGDLYDCFYVDSRMYRPLKPAARNVVTLSAEFLERYAERVRHA